MTRLGSVIVTGGCVMHLRLVPLAVGALLLVAGCGSAGPTTVASVAPVASPLATGSPQVASTQPVIDPACHFPPGTTAAWWGQTTLRAVGLEPRVPLPTMAGADPDDMAMVYVTVEPIYLYVGPGPSSQQQAPVRAYCAVYPARSDGQHPYAFGFLPEDWQPPG